MKEEKLTRLKILRVMPYRLLHFLIKEKILNIFLTECLNNNYSQVLKNRIERGVFQNRISSLRDIHEFEKYFTFSVSTTFTASVWWRYAFKYKKEYSWKV